MITLRPPPRCPSCGALPSQLTKRWERWRAASGKVLRYPLSLSATYHCGASIEAQFLVRGALSGITAGAEWQLVPLGGCRNAMEDLLERRRARRPRRQFTLAGFSQPSKEKSHVSTG